MGQGLWDLDDDADQLDRASQAWADLGTALGDAADDVNAGAGSLVAAGWEGDTATAFDGHRKQLVASLDRGTRTADRIAQVLAASAGSVRVAQGQLDLEWSRVVTIDHTGSPSGEIRWQPADEAEGRRVREAVQAAQQVRDRLGTTLEADRAVLERCTGAWDDVASTWASVAGGADPFDLPTEDDDTGVLTVGDQTVVDAGGGDDEVQVWRDLLTGGLVVVVNGVTYRLPPGQRLTVRGGEGDDTITVPSGYTVDLTLTGGEGDDEISGGTGDDTVLGLDGDDQVDGGDGDDRVSGGAGRDYLDGQDGDDTVTGGEGDDTLYGLDGDDALSGGEGQDYHEGGTGDDTVLGGEGDDVLSGGDGDDVLDGGEGDDVSYAGRGDDTTYGGTGTDTAHSEDGDRDVDVEERVTVDISHVPEFIRIEGSPEFVARVRADLQLLASSPTGQQMLANLEENHEDSGFLGINRDTLTIKEFTGDNNLASHDGRGNSVVEYNTHRDRSVDDRPPLVGLYHELGHVYDYMNGTSEGGTYQGDDADDHGVNNSERQAAGLPIDHDGDPATPEVIDPDHPEQFTENGLRDELGWDRRDHYSG